MLFQLTIKHKITHSLVGRTTSGSGNGWRFEGYLSYNHWLLPVSFEELGNRNIIGGQSSTAVSLEKQAKTLIQISLNFYGHAIKVPFLQSLM